MRGDERVQDGMFSYVSLEQRVPADHHLRAVRKLTDRALLSLSAEFDNLYSDLGRSSIAPEYVLRALLLQVFFSIRSERQLVEQIDYNLLFRWFVGLGMDDAVWNHAVFSKNRGRLLTSEVAQRAMVTHADGYAERDAALMMLDQKQRDRSRRITVGADKAFDTQDFVVTARAMNVTAHVTKNDKRRRSNLDRRTTRHRGDAISLSRRWLVEKGFGWLKQTGPLRQVKLRGLEKVGWTFVFSCAAHNLIRLPRLIVERHEGRLRESCV
jgi:transposase